MRCVLSLVASLVLVLSAVAAEGKAESSVADIEEVRYDKAINDETEALRRDPRSADAYNNRGVAWKEKGEVDRAIDDYNMAIGLEPRLSTPYSNRGLAWKAKGEYDKAINDFREAIRLSKSYSSPHKHLAWLLATCPDEKYRDATAAVEHATTACELTNWKDWQYMGTLAVAYAEAGDFEKAVEFEMKSQKLCPEDEKAWSEKRLALYEAGKPFQVVPEGM